MMKLSKPSTVSRSQTRSMAAGAVLMVSSIHCMIVLPISRAEIFQIAIFVLFYTKPEQMTSREILIRSPGCLRRPQLFHPAGRLFDGKNQRPAPQRGRALCMRGKRGFAKGYDTAGSFTRGAYRCLDTRRTYGGCALRSSGCAGLGLPVRQHWCSPGFLF